jgi:hypothetical protein
MFYYACLFDLQWKVIAFRVRTHGGKKYSTRWIFVLRVTNDEKLTKMHRTRELPPYANSHEWHFAKHIALVCAGLYIWLIIAIDIQTLYNLIVTQTFAFFRNLIQHTHNSFATHIPFFDNLTRIYTLWLFILWELFPRGSSMYDAHYSHLPRLVDHKSTHKLPLRTYIPSYLLKC